MAPRLMTRKRWHMNFGDTQCGECGWNTNEMTVVYDMQTKLVTIDHHFGCYGGTRKDDETIGEALEWLRMERRWWGEGGEWFDGVIWDLGKFLED